MLPRAQWPTRRGLAALGALAASGALLACSLDDREVGVASNASQPDDGGDDGSGGGDAVGSTEPVAGGGGSGSAGESNDPGSAIDFTAIPVPGQGAAVEDACATCIDAECAAEGMACNADPACGAYFECLLACSGSAACALACQLDNPGGAELAQTGQMCASEQCSEACGILVTPPAAGGGASSGVVLGNLACNPDGPGRCQSASDCAVIDAVPFDTWDGTRCPCGYVADAADCSSCLSAELGSSAGCSPCFAEWLACIELDGLCFFSCTGDLTDPSCRACIEGSACTDELSACMTSDPE